MNHNNIPDMKGNKAAGGTGCGAFEGEVFEGMLGQLDDSILYDTLNALCEKQMISAAGDGSVSGSDAETIWFDLDKDGTADLGITAGKGDDGKVWNMEYTPDNSISGDWCIDVDEALGDDMTDGYYDSLRIKFPIKHISIEVDPPVSGITVESDEFWNQTNAPSARPADTEQYVSKDIFAWWTADTERSEPFSGTITKGETYIAYLQIETADGRDYDPDVRVTVNGKPPVSVCRDEDQLFLLKVIACVEVQ